MHVHAVGQDLPSRGRLRPQVSPYVTPESAVRGCRAAGWQSRDPSAERMETAKSLAASSRRDPVSLNSLRIGVPVAFRRAYPEGYAAPLPRA